MKKTNIFAMLLSLACAAGMTACDEDAVKQELQAPVVSETAGNYQSLDFEWTPVANTTQYGYKLYDPEGIVVEAGVTQDTKAHFSELLPSTTYKLLVWAFAGPDTDYTTSPAAELTATTGALIKLETPSGLTVTDANGAVTATWNAVQGAESYSYALSSSAGMISSGTTVKTSVKISGLEEGDYTFSVSALTTAGGYLPSDAATAELYLASTVTESWRANGTYYSEIMGRSWNATIIAYSDGTYSIPAFYGVEGYDFNFTVESNGMITILSGTPNGDYYRTVPTGVESVGDLFVYPSEYQYTGFDGSSKGGDIWIGYYDQYWNETWYTDSFNWNGMSSSITIDDLVGTYNNHSWGSTWITDDWSELVFDDSDWTATVEKIDADTISLDGLYYTECPIIGTFNASAMTITFQPQTYAEWYVFAATSDPGDPVVAKVSSDGTISFPEYKLFYDTYYYLIAESVLTPERATKASPAPKKTRPAHVARPQRR